MNDIGVDMQKLVDAALSDTSLAQQMIESVKEKLSEAELRGLQLAVKTTQYLLNMSKEELNSLEESMTKYKEVPILDKTDRIYAETLTLLLKKLRVDKSDIKAEGDEPEDQGGDQTMGIGLSSGGPSSEPRYRDTEHIEEEEYDEPK